MDVEVWIYKSHHSGYRERFMDAGGFTNHITAGTEKDLWMPKVVEKILFEECDVFSKNESAIGNISDFQMDIK